MKLSVIITTYNSEEWLKKVLVGYANQTEKDFEIVIADDGSTSKTKVLLSQFEPSFLYPIIHVWQEDKGFQKCKILNKAIVKSHSEYLLFTDGDCIPREDFVATHLKYKEKGYFLSGGYFKLPMSTSNSISTIDIVSKKCFHPFWLAKNNVKKNFKLSKLVRFKPFTLFMNWITTTKKTFNGHNTSCFKSDLIAINGFNEDMKYGGLDREVGERLFNYGVLAKQIRYSAICLHLDHERGYLNKEEWNKNLKIRAYNQKHHVIQTKNGLNQYLG
ncbi:glycosyltransferase family 2 protein [Flavobacterium sp. J27]|uniref:glycosyltransferase family 2 protein n=1 Tax=Flavobacterium sp. J27 TaxID=2060419 RepID=UPI0010301074|nr:glycosyltransferase family 2 protein [Flavobacterium sp. J27]